MFSSRSSGRPLTLISRDAISLYLVDPVEVFQGNCHEYSSCAWALLKKCPRS